MRFYNVLNKQVFSNGNYSIVPIRMEDSIDIMNWRNEQIYHLRQKKPLTAEEQKLYFDNVIEKLFNENQPKQILFSYLEKEKCVGYGGLVHINWIDKHAEISFVMNTRLEKDFFKFHWMSFLQLLEEVAFNELNLHKIYTYAFDIRPNLFEVLSKLNYLEEAILNEHVIINETYVNIRIHSKINKN
jgi:RimJ/RimL family protein N-acetyltransferase